MSEIEGLSVRATPGHFFVSWDHLHDVDFVEVSWWNPGLRTCDSKCVRGDTTLCVDTSAMWAGDMCCVAVRIVTLDSTGPWRWRIVEIPRAKSVLGLIEVIDTPRGPAVLLDELHKHIVRCESK